MNEVLVIGGGSWGTSFANYLTRHYRKVKIWIREEEIIEVIKERRENPVFLPGIRLSEHLEPVENLEEEVKNAKIIITAVPSKFIRNVFSRIRDVVDEQIIINLSKGFESKSLKTISQIAVEIFGERILQKWVTLSGPSFAKELSSEHPTAIVAGSSNEELLKTVQKKFSSPVLRIYRSRDLAGIEVGGSLKNIMAIASGILNGLGFGYNSTASLVTRAIIEISRFGQRLGASQITFWGLAGIGDLMLTCFGPLSRNYQLGIKIAQGYTLERFEQESVMIAEGVETTKAINNLAKRYSIGMPITEKVYEILFKNKPPQIAIKELMTRSLKSEWNLN